MQLTDKISISTSKKQKQAKPSPRVKKPDPEMELEGNQKLNQIKKKQFKKDKKERSKKDKIAMQLSSGLENFSLNSENKDDSYNFDTDFNM